MFADDDLSTDGFLGGRVSLLQPRAGFRSSVDAVLLAAAVPAKAGDRVLDLGCGAGAAALCLGVRVPGVALSGLEIQPGYAALARRNAERNGMSLAVFEGDVGRPPPDLRAQVFDHVMANPPYYRGGAGTPARDAGRERALRAEDDLSAWVAAGLRRLSPGGWLTVIQGADRLPELLAALPRNGAGAVVLPVTPREGRAATRVILRARKGGRSPFVLLSPFVLHAGDRHERDGEDFRPAARAVLREAAPLEF